MSPESVKPPKSCLRSLGQEHGAQFFQMTPSGQPRCSQRPLRRPVESAANSGPSEWTYESPHLAGRPCTWPPQLRWLLRRRRAVLWNLDHRPSDPGRTAAQCGMRDGGVRFDAGWRRHHRHPLNGRCRVRPPKRRRSCKRCSGWEDGSACGHKRTERRDCNGHGQAVKRESYSGIRLKKSRLGSPREIHP